MELTPELAKEYEDLYATAIVKPEKQETMKWYVNNIQRNQARYEAVSAKTAVPWHVIAAIHAMESSMDFGTHLHNGDPLSAKTVHVPAGRPKTHDAPFTWEESAIDALGYDGASSIKVWSLERTLHFLQAFNGFGYLTGAGRATTPPKRSPYLWSYTQHYQRGRYVKDGEFDVNSVSDQAGVVAIFKGLESRKLIAPLGGAVVPPPETRWEDVTWFEMFRLEHKGEIVSGCAAMAGSTVHAVHTGIDKFSLIKFLEQYPRANHILVAPSGKRWPGDLKSI